MCGGGRVGKVPSESHQRNVFEGIMEGMKSVPVVFAQEEKKEGGVEAVLIPVSKFEKTNMNGWETAMHNGVECYIGYIGTERIERRQGAAVYYEVQPPLPKAVAGNGVFDLPKRVDARRFAKEPPQIKK